MTKPVKKATQDQGQVEELKADLQRIQAEFINFKRRSEGERAELVDLIKQDVIFQLLPLLDNFARALDHQPPELADNPWAAGVQQVAKQVGETLASLGVTAYGEAGDQFDPNRYEAIAHDGEGDHVTEVFQKGYQIGDKVIRPAMVKVGSINSNHKKELSHE